MKTFVYLFISVLSLTIMSCKRTAPIERFLLNDSLFQTIVIDPYEYELDMEEYSFISGIADSVAYIPLQSEDSILIGQISKMIVWQDEYYIWDELSETIFRFDSIGKFKGRLHERGQGPKEYPNISDFTLNRQNGNIVIFSNQSRGFYEYTNDFAFVKRVQIPFLMSSFAAAGDRMYCYLGRLPNEQFYEKTFPEQCRYVVLNDGVPQYEQLPHIFDDSFLEIALSNKNFTFYGDTTLFIEDLDPKIYQIDSVGGITPRYHIKFTSNEYIPTFDDKIDLDRMNRERKDETFTHLWGDFFENRKYLFFSYARGMIGTVYVDKTDGSIHNQGYFLLDDLNHKTLSVTTDYVDERYMYKTEDASRLIDAGKKQKQPFSPYLQEVCSKLQEFDNPVIVKIRLK